MAEKLDEAAIDAVEEALRSRTYAGDKPNFRQLAIHALKALAELQRSPQTPEIVRDANDSVMEMSIRTGRLLPPVAL